ncbi:MAG: DUF2069 domain-containing protein [Pseudomonadota bacterium]
MTARVLSIGYSRACFVLTSALIGVITTWQLSAELPLALRLGLLGLFALPLVATLPGLARRRVYTARWACLMMSVYIGLALTETVVSTDARLVTSAMAGLSCALFVVLVLAIRRTVPA